MTAPRLINDVRTETLMMNFLLLSRQLAGVSTCLTNLMRVPLHPDRSEGPYISYIQTELSDMTETIRQMCLLLGLDFDETIELGEGRREEKKADFLRRYPNIPWY